MRGLKAKHEAKYVRPTSSFAQKRITVVMLGHEIDFYHFSDGSLCMTEESANRLFGFTTKDAFRRYMCGVLAEKFYPRKRNLMDLYLRKAMVVTQDSDDPNEGECMLFLPTTVYGAIVSAYADGKQLGHKACIQKRKIFTGEYKEVRVDGRKLYEKIYDTKGASIGDICTEITKEYPLDLFNFVAEKSEYLKAFTGKRRQYIEEHFLRPELDYLRRVLPSIYPPFREDGTSRYDKNKDGYDRYDLLTMTVLRYAREYVLGKEGETRSKDITLKDQPIYQTEKERWAARNYLNFYCHAVVTLARTRTQKEIKNHSDAASKQAKNIAEVQLDTLFRVQPDTPGGAALSL